MVLLNDVVQVANRSASTARPEFASPLEFGNGDGYDGLRFTLIARGRGCPGELNAFCRKRFAAAASRVALRRKSMGAGGIYRPI